MTLVGVQNNSRPVSSIHLSAENELFAFELDGICTPRGTDRPGCLVSPKTPSANRRLSRKSVRMRIRSEERAKKPVTEPVSKTVRSTRPQASPQAYFPHGIVPVAMRERRPGKRYEGRRRVQQYRRPRIERDGCRHDQLLPAIARAARRTSRSIPPAGGFGSASTLNPRSAAADRRRLDHSPPGQFRD